MRTQKGLTLTEMMIVVAITSIVAAGFGLVMSKNFTFFERIKVRQRVTLQSRQCLELIQQTLRNAKAKTIVISTPAATPEVPNSRIDFTLKTNLASGATAYAIYLQNRTVFAQEFTPGIARAARPIANDVSGLMFTGDYRDPGIIRVSLRIDAYWDATRDSNKMTTLIHSNQVVRTAETP